MYEINLKAGSIVAGPAPIPTELIGLAQESLADLSAALDPCPEQYKGRGFWPARNEAAAHDPVMQRLSDQIDEVPDPATQTVIVRRLVVNLTPAELEARLSFLRAERKVAATDLRWQKETGGIVINGVPVATDDRSKMLILGKRAQAQSNPAATFRWKAASGDWVDLTGALITAIADAVADHVQACFDREGELHDAIDAASDAAAVLAVDISAGWP